MGWHDFPTEMKASKINSATHGIIICGVQKKERNTQEIDRRDTYPVSKLENKSTYANHKNENGTRDLLYSYKL